MLRLPTELVYEMSKFMWNRYIAHHSRRGFKSNLLWWRLITAKATKMWREHILVEYEKMEDCEEQLSTIARELAELERTLGLAHAETLKKRKEYRATLQEWNQKHAAYVMFRGLPWGKLTHWCTAIVFWENLIEQERLKLEAKERAIKIAFERGYDADDEFEEEKKSIKRKRTDVKVDKENLSPKKMRK